MLRKGDRNLGMNTMMRDDGGQRMKVRSTLEGQRGIKVDLGKMGKRREDALTTHR